MAKFCSNCGAQATGSFCSSCGKPIQPNPDSTTEYVGTSYIEPTGNNYNVQSPKMSVNKNKGCLRFFGFFFFIFIVGLIFSTIYGIMKEGIPSINNQNVQDTEEDIVARLLEFDEKSWKDFKLLYASHNTFMINIASFSDNKVNTLDFYNSCTEVEEYFTKFYNSLGYGTNQDEKDYLSTFETVSLNDQVAAKYLKKYIDSGKTSDLSKAQECITAAKNTFTTIAENRGLLLVKTGLTDEEIKKRVEEDMADLE